MNEVMPSHCRNFHLRKRKNHKTPQLIASDKLKAKQELKNKSIKKKSFCSSLSETAVSQEYNSSLPIKEEPSASFVKNDEIDLDGLKDHVIFTKINFNKKDEEDFNNLMHNPIPSKGFEKRVHRNSFSEVLFPLSEDLEKCRCVYRELFPKVKNKNQNVPKILEKLPYFQTWEQILVILKPETWTTVTIYQVCQVFHSILKDSMLQSFFYVILLPYLRNHIAVHKTIDIPLYKVLKLSLSKPAVIFKSIIIPLCESGDCTLREATIFGLFLQANEMPVLYISSALIVIAGLQYTGAASVFLRVLLEKPLSFPHRTVCALFTHFVKFMDDKRQYPVIWHKSLLAFVQRCKHLLSDDQRGSLLKLVTSQHNCHISPSIQKELLDFSIPSSLVPDL